MTGGTRWRAACGRLATWQDGGLPRGADALAALDDIATVRRLTDRAELAAVRVAREHGSSWTEIAVHLGVTRQSAWERWRDLDEPGSTSTPRPGRRPGRTIAAEDDVELTVVPTVPEVAVPRLVGTKWDDARAQLHSLGLVAESPDPDGPPLAAIGWPNGVVSAQHPDPGAVVPRGSVVLLWIEGGGGSAGVREPRVTPPTPRRGRLARNLDDDLEFGDSAPARDG